MREMCDTYWEIGSEAEGMWPWSGLDKAGLGPSAPRTGSQFLLDLCMRCEQIDSVDSSRDRIALRDLIEYVAPAGTCTAPALASARCRVHRASTNSVLCCTRVRRVLCCTSARRRVHRASTSGTPCYTTEHVPTAAYAAPDTVIEYVASAGICTAPAPADVTERWRDADMSESMSEMSQDAAVNDDGLLDTVFDAICELAGGRRA